MNGIRRTLAAALLSAIAVATGAPGAAAGVINVEIDWLTAADHDHRPADCEIDAVAASFAASGVTLNVEFSDQIQETAANQVIDFVTPNPFENGEWAALEAQYRDHPAGTGWHYAIIGHNYSYNGNFTTSSGFAEILGDELLVSLGSFFGSTGVPWDRAGTFMHELGHNLGLRHAGDQDENMVRQYKPNYASVMSYRFQLIGVATGMSCWGLATTSMPFNDLDYSHGTLDPLDESALDESFGIGLGAVDWDCSGGIGGVVAKDVSSTTDWCIGADLKTWITDYDDWSNIMDVAFQLAPDTHEEAETATCITYEEAEAYVGVICLKPDPCKIVALCQGKDRPDSNVLYVNASRALEISVPSGAPLAFSIVKPPAGGNGKFVAHLNSGAPDSGTVTVLPASLGASCFPMLLPPFGTAAPVCIWNNVGKRNKIGDSVYFGGAIPDPDRAPTLFFQSANGDPANFPLGSVWTLQAVILNPTATSPKGGSVTNAIRIVVTN